MFASFFTKKKDELTVFSEIIAAYDDRELSKCEWEDFIKKYGFYSRVASLIFHLRHQYFPLRTKEDYEKIANSVYFLRLNAKYLASEDKLLLLRTIDETLSRRDFHEAKYSATTHLKLAKLTLLHRQNLPEQVSITIFHAHCAHIKDPALKEKAESYVLIANHEWNLEQEAAKDSALEILRLEDEAIPLLLRPHEAPKEDLAPPSP